GEEPLRAAIDAFRGNRAGAGAAPGSATDPGRAETRSGHAYRGAAARAPRDAGSAAVRPDSVTRRPTGQARRIRRRTRRTGENRRAARAVACTGARCRGLARRVESAARIHAYAAADRARRGAELPATGRRSRGRGSPRAEPRTRVEFRARRALRRMPASGRDAPDRAGRALARRSQPGRGAVARPRNTLPTPAALGKSTDVSRSEPRARQSLAHAPRVGW